jgi:hypothetical protein
MLWTSDGVKELKIGGDKLDKSIQTLNTSQENIKKLLDNINNEINKQLPKNKAQELKATKDPKDQMSKFKNITIPNELKPGTCPSKYAPQPSEFAGVVNPIPGRAYLDETKAKYIYGILQKNESIDEARLENLIQENLEVWHPPYDTKKCGRK